MEKKKRSLIPVTNEGFNKLSKMISEDLKFDDKGNFALVGVTQKIIVLRKEHLIKEKEL